MGPERTPLLIDCGAEVITSFCVTAVVVIVNVCTVLVFTSPFAVPPLSWICTDTVAVPLLASAYRSGFPPGSLPAAP